MDTEKQRQHRHDDARLTESRKNQKQAARHDDARLTNSRNARSEQLLYRDAYRVAKLLSGLEHQRPGWFLDVQNQTCSPAC